MDSYDTKYEIIGWSVKSKLISGKISLIPQLPLLDAPWYLTFSFINVYLTIPWIDKPHVCARQQRIHFKKSATSANSLARACSCAQRSSASFSLTPHLS